MDLKSSVTKIDSSKTTTQAAIASSTAPHTETCDILFEIEKLTKEINSLLEKAPKDDPAYQTNVKKLVEIKTYLERKLDPSKRNLFEKILRRKKRVNIDSNSAYVGETESLFEAPSEFLLEQIEQRKQPQDLVNVNLDDSILFGIDSIVCAYQFIKSIYSE